MKVIGISGRDTYICEVKHTELEKFMNLYYGNMKTLTAGSEIDLGKGYDFASEAKSACKQTSDFIENNKRCIETIMDGITFLGQIDPLPSETENKSE